MTVAFGKPVTWRCYEQRMLLMCYSNIAEEVRHQLMKLPRALLPARLQ